MAMTQYERMERGLLYDCSDAEICSVQDQFKAKIQEFNQLGICSAEVRERCMKEMLAECGEGCFIEAPFHANWGGHHVHIGSRVYANYNLTMVDDGHIYVGDAVLFGPNVTVITATHPIDPPLRKQAYQYNKDVYIGENAWIGAGAMILPGVHIGKNSVIGAGSVVVKDIPDNVVAVGNPCRVLRPIDERDSQYYDHDCEIDWEELESEFGVRRQ